MPRYLLLLIFFLVLVVNQTKAQSNTVISGQIISKDTKENIPFASVAVLSEKEELINGSITSENGRFMIEGLSKGTYMLSVSFIGYNTYQSELLIGELNQNYDLGKIELENAAVELDEVTVAGQRAEIASDLNKKSYDMSNNIAQSGGSVMDAMKAMPSVSFDQDGKIILRGSDKVIVLIDGKQSSLTGYGNQKGLDNIPAANIERIEIINNPSAKYDASGMAGIINIIYKKEQQYGWHGSVGLAYGLGVLSKAKADLPTTLGSFSQIPKYIPSLDLNFKKEKLSVFLQSEVLFQKTLPNNEFTTRNYDDARIIASQVPENRKQTHYILKGGMDYRFNDNNTLTFSGIYDWEMHVDTAQVPYINLADGTRNRYIAWNEEEITGYMNYALHYEHKFKQVGHSLNTHLQYTKGWEDETYHINDSSHVRAQGRDVTNILAIEHTTSLNLDYQKPMRTGRLESGAKLQVRNLPVEYTQQRGENSILYPGLGSWTKWGESIYAGYLNWVHEKTKYNIEAGLRAEYTTVFYDMDPANIYYQQNDAYDYFKLFPNVRLTYKLNDHNKLSVFYNFRIDRPGEPELRMYSKSDDHELVKVGNPYLRPQLTQSFELAYKFHWEGGSVFVAGYYRFIEDPYMRVYTQDLTNTDYDVVLKSYANTGEATNRGFEFVISQQVLKFWKLAGNFNYYQNKLFAYQGLLLFPYEHTFDIPETIDDTWDFKVINTFSLPYEFEAQLTGLYFAPKNMPQGKQLSRSSIDIGLKKKLWEGKGELTLAATDLFNKYGIRQEVKGDGFSALYENYYETQVIRIGMKYRF